ncbi:hypothetical protein C8J57DRAFT_970134, partial [Mycena rebaudengoi]
SGSVGTAEAATLQLEMRWLAQLTGNKQLWYKAERVMSFINKARIPNGMVPVSLLSLFIRLGTNGDSYHEYLL